MQELVEEMIAITGGSLTKEKAQQYLRYGKNDLQVALNYYYQAEEKKMRQQPQAEATKKLLEGARKQQKLEKIIKDLKEEYNKPIELCLKEDFPQKKQSGNLDFQQTNDIEEIAMQYAQTKNEQRQKITQEQTQLKEEQNTQFQNQTIAKDNNKTKNQKKNKTSITQEKQKIDEISQEILQEPQQFQANTSNIQKISIKEGMVFPVYIGSAAIKGYALGNQNLQKAQHQPLQIFLDGSCKVSEKGKTKVVKGQNIVRMSYDNNEIGRLNQEYEDLFGLLLQDKYIVIHGQHTYSPMLCKTHDTIFLKIDVLLNEKAFTAATTDQYDDSLQICVKYRENFQKLFDLLDCQLLVSTLIEVDRKKLETYSEVKENSNTNTFTKANVLYQDDPFKQKPKQRSLNDFSMKTNQQKQEIQKIEPEKQSEENLQVENIDCDQLLGFSKCAHHSLEYHDGPNQLASQLFNYQKQALTWLLQREGVIEYENENTSRTLHPLWKEYITVQHMKFYFNPFSGQVSLDYPSSSKRCNGGILADEMGLGKTVMLISLILSNPFKIPQEHTNKKQQIKQSGKKLIADYVGYTKKKWAKTLIIVPVSLLSQWQDELNHHCDMQLKIFQYTGVDRNQYDLSQFDIVLSSYHTIMQEYKRSSKDPYSVYNFTWFRVILDEAHYIKGRTTLLALSAYELDAHYRWCSTGTPIQNNLNDMFSLLHFIKLEPWSDYYWWNAYINKPHEDGKQEVFTLLNIILTPILLRRTKKSKDANGKPIISLPDKIMHIEEIDLLPDEKIIYEKVEKRSQDEIEGFLAKGILMSQYMKVFEILLRLRQICDHPLLITTRSDVKNIDQLEDLIDKFLANQQLDREDQEELLMNNQQIQICLDKIKYKQEVIQRVKENDIPPCPVCLEQVDDAIVTICLHFLCRLCLQGVLQNTSQCPYCRKFITKQDTMTLPRESSFSVNWKDNYRRSSKIEKIMNIINQIPKTEKCVIFTQFIGMIEMIQFDLDKQNIKYLRLDGSMSQQQRADVLRMFKESNEHRIFIISLKAGGVGLNLTTANHCIMVDPWWNPAVEEQAIERVYRIGQDKITHVYRLICKETVEQRMIQLHEIKKKLFESSVRTEEKSALRIEMFKNIILGK